MKPFKHNHVKEKNKKYEIITHSVDSEITVHVDKNEQREIKRSLIIYSFYKYFRYFVFMNSYRLSISIILAIAILSNSIISLGYVLICLYMIY